MTEDLADAASAYLAWWDMAGVDCATAEEPVNWLRPAPAVPLAPAPSSPATVKKPGSLQEFTDWLARDSAQPERRWPGTPISPQGQAGSPLMVITDMPDPADMDAGTLLADRAGRLFDAMLSAVGLSRESVYIASLFCARPPGGMVEAADLNAAADRMRTHVSLAIPGRLLLLGDRTIRTFLPVQDRQGMESLHFFNHDGGTVPALATFHPRLLLGQPAAKAECWRTLQRLVEDMHQ
ncbi:uracil-DNA glycosylase family protein [Novosphingobium sp. Chol11]|uniref:uracil-DNA glycosylase family protein n=1 Tax=Novosphingobium sp. Chol11 TaxID=1385763 RepID=UPI000BE24413|nr:uracil-DNA glycosylase family protein [Novosphingobium sp. Chol11]